MEMFLNRDGWLNRFTCFMLGVNEYYYNNTDICYFTRAFIKACLILIWRTFWALFSITALIGISFFFGEFICQKVGFIVPESWLGMVLMYLVGLTWVALLVAIVFGFFIGWFFVKDKLENWWNKSIEDATPPEDITTLTKLIHSWKHKYCVKVRLK